MPRKIKRLGDAAPKSPVAQLIRDNPQAWEAELEWWRRRGIHTGLLRTALASAGVARRQYERQLQAYADDRFAAEMRGAATALQSAKPLIALLKTARTEDCDRYFGALAEQVERGVETYIAARRRLAVPAHRARDPWIQERVVRLARCLRARQCSWRGTTRAIHRLFVLSGHGDVVTVDSVRHIIKAERRRDPSFGPPRPDPRDGRGSPLCRVPSPSPGVPALSRGAEVAPAGRVSPPFCPGPNRDQSCHL
jgi:hypothetical protein